MFTRRQTLAAGLAGLTASALPTLGRAQDVLKIGLVHVGPVTDNGWTYRHDLGRAAVEAAYGDRVSTRTVENVKPGADSERVMEGLIEDGCRMIINTGSDHQTALHRVARRHPDVVFEHVVGTKLAPNVATYAGRFYEGRYVQGLVAGHLTRSGVAGYIASFPIPEVIRAINGFTLGFRKHRPDGQLRVIWINSWYDPAREGDTARVLIDQGADIISQHTDSPAAIEVAQQAGVYAYGLSTDMSAFGAQAHINSILKNWDPYYVQRVGQVLDGTWTSADFWGGLDTDVVSLTDYADFVPVAVAQEALAAEAAIKAGTLDVFAGPITAQDGSNLIDQGATADDDMLRRMMTYVDGVVGTIPG